MLSRARCVRVGCTPVVVALLVTGCIWGGPELGTVTGTVTLDGEPLANAQVEFQPRQGSPSYGTTDRLGRYELEYTKDKPGAIVGTHVVRITTQTTRTDASGNEVQVPQRVPERYNYRSELIEQVAPGENKIDFRLESEAETEGPVTPQAQPETPGEENPKAEQPRPEEAIPEAPGTEQPEVKPQGTGEP